MTTSNFNIGDRVAWRLFDGRTMAGTIRDRAIASRNAMVERVDGTIVSVGYIRLRPATEDDILAACEVFKGWQEIESGRGDD